MAHGCPCLAPQDTLDRNVAHRPKEGVELGGLFRTLWLCQGRRCSWWIKLFLSRIPGDALPVKQQHRMARQTRICLSLPVPIHLMHPCSSRIQCHQIRTSCRGVSRGLKQEDRSVELSRVVLSFCAHRLDVVILDDHPQVEITEHI